MLVLSAQWQAWRNCRVWPQLVILFVLLLTTGVRTAQGEAFDVWQVDESGAQQEPVTAILQSRDGYLWLGTYHGLIRFDGVRSVVYDSGNTPGLQNGLVTSLFESSDGVMWIGHETGQLTR